MTVDWEAAIAELERRRDDITAALELLRGLYGRDGRCGTHQEALSNLDKKRVEVERPILSKNKTRRKAGVAKGLPQTGEPHGRQSPLQYAILDMLTHTPMTSIEIFEKLQKAGFETTAGSVYQTVRVLLEKGLTSRTKNDEGRVAWSLVGQ